MINNDNFIIDKNGVKYYFKETISLTPINETENINYFSGKIIHKKDTTIINYSDGRTEEYKYELNNLAEMIYINQEDEPTSYWLNGELHRDDGPAIKYDNTEGKYYINNKETSRYVIYNISNLKSGNFKFSDIDIINHKDKRILINYILKNFMLLEKDIKGKTMLEAIAENINNDLTKEDISSLLNKEVYQIKLINNNVGFYLINKFGNFLDSNHIIDIIDTLGMKNIFSYTDYVDLGVIEATETKKENIINYLMSKNYKLLTEDVKAFILNSFIKDKELLKTDESFHKTLMDLINRQNWDKEQINFIFENFNFDNNINNLIFKEHLNFLDKNKIDELLEKKSFYNNFNIGAATILLSKNNILTLKQKNIDNLIKEIKLAIKKDNGFTNNKQHYDMIYRFLAYNKSENLRISKEDIVEITKDLLENMKDKKDSFPNYLKMILYTDDSMIDETIESLKVYVKNNKTHCSSLYVGEFFEKKSIEAIGDKRILDLYNFFEKNIDLVGALSKQKNPQILSLNIDFCLRTIEINYHYQKDFDINHMHPILKNKLNLKKEDISGLIKYNKERFIHKIGFLSDKEQIQKEIYAEYEILKRKEINTNVLSIINIKDEEIKNSVVSLLEKLKDFNEENLSEFYANNLVQLKLLVEIELIDKIKENNDIETIIVIEKINEKINELNVLLTESDNLELLALSNIEELKIDKDEAYINFKNNNSKKFKLITKNESLNNNEQLLVENINERLIKINKNKNILYDYQYEIVEGYTDKINKAISIYDGIKTKELKSGRLNLSPKENFENIFKNIDNELEHFEKVSSFVNLMEIRKNSNIDNNIRFKTKI